MPHRKLQPSLQLQSIFFQLDISRSSILNEDSSSSDNETVSVIELHPGAEDDGADLACRAAHTRPRSSPAASHASDVVRISILCE